jgi:NAD(P)-dependent dehydrogenase (short-subunit alcohol dehydrogenase family)
MVDRDIFFKTLFSLEGHVALVTGGSKGLGRTIAETLSMAGAEIAICSRKNYRVLRYCFPLRLAVT